MSGAIAEPKAAIQKNICLAREGKIVDIKCGKLFPLPFFILGGAIFLAGIGSATQLPLTSAFLLFLGAVVLTAHEGTDIDPNARTFREYNSFLFFIKTGKKLQYDSIEKIFVNSARVSQRLYTAHTSSSSVYTNVEYNAWLKLGDGRKVFLASGRNKARLLKRFKAVALALNTEFTDTTRHQHKQ